ncbi:hypothetical protein HZF05_06305 [Sphingomonas sp. CGMCC 1.13654]|uniref:VOC domain-containing protein n=1 Tax=Sphingomonas chungangi TaxID=2683589 RepID=A0A838L839_9SPHN|nr:hypothetical protein [Sphingomonas chungangi]MBA2933708.1 hypothetical protein [Sphingomonas chungangi]MVW55040.1 hypothetical protein [Sphingomonas chungangi]
MVPKFCRMAWLVDDMTSFTAEMGDLLGARFRTPGLIAELYPDAGFKVMFGEHGIEPIEPGPGGLPFGGGERLIEIAIDVADAEAVRARLGDAGFEPAAISYLPVPAVNEYLFGRDFHGIPFLACTEGVNEAQLRSEAPFDALAEAAPPKIGCVELVVADADALAADLKKFYDMDFIETDPAGLGRRALAGSHRVKLIEGPTALLDDLELPLAAIDVMHGDVESARRGFEAAGFKVRHARALQSGGHAYFFGPTVQGLPITLYPESADAEMIGLFERELA